ncbi:hypothetical protein EJ07DRAFT_159584 [Lizonia empirigonia]|nr:hypothetical protein EJ07DRAFT_159584 [Lizonia empirigonia]
MSSFRSQLTRVWRPFNTSPEGTYRSMLPGCKGATMLTSDCTSCVLWLRTRTCNGSSDIRSSSKTWNNLMDLQNFHRSPSTLQTVLSSCFVAALIESSPDLIFAGFGSIRRFFSLHKIVMVIAKSLSESVELRCDGGTWSTSTSWFEDAWSHMGRLTRVSFEKYYSRTRGFVATDPRDKFYALLHLGVNTRAAVQKNPLLSPNYEIPLECLILNFFRAGIELPLHIRINYGKILSDPCGSDCGNNFWEPFAFGFWHDVEAVNLRKTNNYEVDPLDLDDITPGQGYEVAKVGRRIWIPRERASGSWDDRSTNEILCGHLSDLLDACRAYVMGLRNETFYHNVLRMIGVSEERISAGLSEFQGPHRRSPETVVTVSKAITLPQQLWQTYAYSCSDQVWRSGGHFPGQFGARGLDTGQTSD